MGEINISIEDIDPIKFFGINNSKLNLIKNAFPKLRINSRGNNIKIVGGDDEVDIAAEKISSMIDIYLKFGDITDRKVMDLLEGGNFDTEEPGVKQHDDIIVHGPGGINVKARTPNQKKMVSMAENNDIIFAIGPAGTGKTYTAVALAVHALKNKEVKKIVLTRPAVEAGESLGFLPGDLKEKVDPYLRPLYDALDDMIPVDKLAYFMTNRVIEIAPLAFMRGRTLDHAYIILDEAQNATELQIKMFLTRIGPSAKCIITGDLTQIDLPRNQRSGLFKALNILKNIEGIATVHLGQEDVIRHRLVKEIIKAYDVSKDEGEERPEEETEKRRK